MAKTKSAKHHNPAPQYVREQRRYTRMPADGDVNTRLDRHGTKRSAMTPTFMPQPTPLRAEPPYPSKNTYTVSGVDLKNFIADERRTRGLSPLERFVREDGGRLQRRMATNAYKPLL